MVPVMSLWLPILLSAAGVFIVSSIIHMLLGYHNSDFKKLSDEDGVMAALRGFKIPPGDYGIPCAGSASAMKSPEFLEKMKQGPIALMTVIPTGKTGMGMSLVLWFIYSVVVGIFAAYVAGRTLGTGADYLAVFRVTGTVAFASYAIGIWQYTIWFKRDWRSTLKSSFDGLIYALVTGGFFGWLWPGQS